MYGVACCSPNCAINSWSSVCWRNFRGCDAQEKFYLPFRDRYDGAFAARLIRSLADKLSCICRARWNHNPLMHDARFDDLANLLVGYSIRLKRNETVLIEVFDVPDEMTIALRSEERRVG